MSDDTTRDPQTPTPDGAAPSGDAPAAAPAYDAPSAPPAYGAPAAPPAYSPPPAAPTYDAPPAYGAPQPPAAPAYGAPGAPQGYPGAAPAYGAPAQGYDAQNYASAPAYGQQPYTPYPTGPATNVLSIVSLIASIANFFVLPFIGGLAGAIMGHISLKQIARTGEKGRGMAIAGVIIGWIGVALGLFFLFFIFWGIGMAAVSGSRYR